MTISRRGNYAHCEYFKLILEGESCWWPHAHFTEKSLKPQEKERPRKEVEAKAEVQANLGLWFLVLKSTINHHPLSFGLFSLS